MLTRQAPSSTACRACRVLRHGHLGRLHQPLQRPVQYRSTWRQCVAEPHPRRGVWTGLMCPPWLRRECPLAGSLFLFSSGSSRVLCVVRCIHFGHFVLWLFVFDTQVCRAADDMPVRIRLTTECLMECVAYFFTFDVCRSC